MKNILLLIAISLISNAGFTQNQIVNNSKYDLEFISQFLIDNQINDVAIAVLTLQKGTGFEGAYLHQVNKDLYNIFLSNNLPKKFAKKIILHELLHLVQYYNEDLVVIDKSKVLYKGKQIILKDYKHDDLPFEKDVFKATTMKLMKQYF